MEPKWLLKNIRLIFADQFITPKLLTKLNIEKTCTLRGDFHHLMNEVWPKQENFGLVAMSTCSPWLRTMLVSADENAWHQSYKSIANFFKNDPHKLRKLDSIYQNPSYYAGYYLKKIVGNLMLLGSVPAEQNHSSIIAYIGDGGNWSIMLHMSKLMSRHQDHVKKKKSEEDLLHVRSYKYKSTLIGQKGIDDCNAKSSLSSYAYKELFVKAMKGADWLQKKLKTMAIYQSGQQTKIKILPMS